MRGGGCTGCGRRSATTWSTRSWAALFPPIGPSVRLAASLRRDLIRFVRFSAAAGAAAGRGGVPRRGRPAAAGWQRAARRPDARLGWPAACTGGCCAASGSSAAGPCPRAAPAGSPTRWCGGSSRSAGGWSCNARVDVGRSCGAVAPSACALADGREISASRAVIADVGAPALFLDLVGQRAPAVSSDRRPRPALPVRQRDGEGRLGAGRADPVVASRRAARRDGARAEGMDALTEYTSQLNRKLIPSDPFLLFGQYSMGDPTRAPDGLRDRVGLHAHAAGGARRRGRRRADRHRGTSARPTAFVARMEYAGRGAGAGLPRPDPRAARVDAASRCRTPTRTWSAARSTAARRSSTSRSSSGRCRRCWGGRRRRCAGCSSDRRRRTRAAACTGRAGRTRRGRRWRGTRGGGRPWRWAVARRPRSRRAVARRR